MCLVGVAGCSSGFASSAEQHDGQASIASLEQQITQLEDQLEEVTSERDELVAQRAADASRYATVTEFTELRNRVASDPSAYGTEDEALDVLMSGAACDAVMDDEAFGAAPLRKAWRNTLFSGKTDAVTTEWRSWICSDGRLGGSLWTWEGDNARGEPFSLVGINLNEYDDQGLLTRSTVIWPYPHDYVVSEFLR